MNLNELKSYLEEKLAKALPSSAFLDNLRLLEEETRKSGAYQDPRYVPFYYWLGTAIKPRSMIEIGFRFGLCSACFFKGCNTVENFSAFQQRTNEYYSPKLGISNVKDYYKKRILVHVGDVNDEGFHIKLSRDTWDLVIINEQVGYDKHKEYLDLIWSKLNQGALIINEYIFRHDPAAEAFRDFCKYKNREPVYIRTRYGVGIIER